MVEFNYPQQKLFAAMINSDMVEFNWESWSLAPKEW